MIFKQVALKLILLCMLVNLPIYCMEEINEENLLTLESIPNELLFLVLQHKIQSIINKKNKAIQRLEKFKKFLSAICLTNKRFYEFKADLEKYFEEHTPKVSNMAFVTTPYRLSFIADNYEFLIEKGNAQSIENFVHNIAQQGDFTIEEIAEAIIKEVESNGSQNNQRQAFEALFGQIIYTVYDAAKDKGNKKAEENIIKLVKPIFKAYPDKPNTIYTNNLEEYGLNPADIID